jgi:hypothetical protein
MTPTSTSAQAPSFFPVLGSACPYLHLTHMPIIHWPWMRSDMLGPSPWWMGSIQTRDLCVKFIEWCWRTNTTCANLLHLYKHLRVLPATFFPEKRLEDIGSPWVGCWFQCVCLSVWICVYIFFPFWERVYLCSSLEHELAIFLPHPLQLWDYNDDYHNWYVFLFFDTIILVNAPFLCYCFRNEWHQPLCFIGHIECVTTCDILRKRC